LTFWNNQTTLEGIFMDERTAEASAPKNKRKRRDRLDPRRVRIKGKILWQVELGSEKRQGKRRRLRKTFASREEALTFAKLRKIERVNHGIAGVNLSERLRGEAVEAAQLLEPFGVSVLDLARQYVERMKLAARSETVQNAVQMLLAAKAGDNLRPRYINDLHTRLQRFVLSFGERKLSDIQAPEIDKWLRELGGAPLTRNTLRMRLSVLFEFARQRGWVATNPILDVPKAKVTGSAPGILSPEQVARLVESASEETLPIFALGIFAGIRSAEIERLEWRHIKWDELLIEVPALSSKTASRRLITIEPNLFEWLKPYRGRQGLICPPNHYNRMIEDRRAAGILDWPNNAMRHSYASYHLAAFRDAPALSLELGHVRPQTVFAHYRELVTPSEAERFWRIVPAISAREPAIAVVA
jgi:integrase